MSRGQLNESPRKLISFFETGLNCSQFAKCHICFVGILFISSRAAPTSAAQTDRYFYVHFQVYHAFSLSPYCITTLYMCLDGSTLTENSLLNFLTVATQKPSEE
jgi:hypothetical protein